MFGTMTTNRCMAMDNFKFYHAINSKTALQMNNLLPSVPISSYDTELMYHVVNMKGENKND